MKYLAIDYGTKRTGLAVCDESETICSPLKVIGGQANLIEQIIKTIETEQIEAVVVGLPLNMDDTQGAQAKIVRDFAEMLRQSLDIDVLFQDERLSSFEAEEKLAAKGFTRKQKKARLDAVAAAAILQSFLTDKGRSA